MEQPSEDDVAALAAVEGGVITDEPSQAGIAARRTRFRSGAELIQVGVAMGTRAL
jgi:hypothetical protein